MDKWMSIGLLITAVVLRVETNEIDQSDTCVWVGVEVNWDHGHNISERPCKAPDKPLNGGYDGDADGTVYETGDTITYHCNRGYQLVGRANRTCTESLAGWEPEEPYCEPEYTGHLMRRLDGIERRIATLENDTAEMKEQISSIEIEVVAFNPQISPNRGRVIACIKNTKVIDGDTVAKCLTMQLGTRNGRGVSELKWTFENYERKVSEAVMTTQYSQLFYHTVPGYTFRLVMEIWHTYEIRVDLTIVPGQDDRQLAWPFNTRYEITVLLNDGTEFLYQIFSSRDRGCNFVRKSYRTEFGCAQNNLNFQHFWTNKRHVLKDGSVVVKIYFYN